MEKLDSRTGRGATRVMLSVFDGMRMSVVWRGLYARARARTRRGEAGQAGQMRWEIGSHDQVMRRLSGMFARRTTMHEARRRVTQTMVRRKLVNLKILL
jgi:hypothetical protein